MNERARQDRIAAASKRTKSKRFDSPAAVQLTDAGRAWAIGASERSVVARVALSGGHGWPIEAYETAANACNAMGEAAVVLGEPRGS